MVTGLETLPTFRPDALVFFRAKVEVSTRAIHIIAGHKSSLAVARSRYLPPEVAVWLPVGRPLTALQCSRPTPGDSLPPIPVEAFPSRGPLDVDGLFQQEFLRSPGPVDHRCVFPVDVVVASQACSATADFCRDWVRQASWCSLSLVSNLRLVSPM